MLRISLRRSPFIPSFDIFASSAYSLPYCTPSQSLRSRSILLPIRVPSAANLIQAGYLSDKFFVSPEPRFLLHYNSVLLQNLLNRFATILARNFRNSSLGLCPIVVRVSKATLLSDRDFYLRLHSAGILRSSQRRFTGILNALENSKLLFQTEQASGTYSTLRPVLSPFHPSNL